GVFLFDSGGRGAGIGLAAALAHGPGHATRLLDAGLHRTAQGHGQPRGQPAPGHHEGPARCRRARGSPKRHQRPRPARPAQRRPQGRAFQKVRRGLGRKATRERGRRHDGGRRGIQQPRVSAALRHPQPHLRPPKRLIGMGGPAESLPSHSAAVDGAGRQRLCPLRALSAGR
nr:hypothetical protein [Tanacetum cinerariifolium]